MKILLINPPYHRVYANVAAAEGISPPLGLAYVAAYLREHGHDVKLVDANAEQIPLKRLCERLPERFDIVGTTSFTPSIESSIGAIRAAIKKNPEAKSVIGGAHMTVAAKETMAAYPEIDFGVMGEGEETIVELADRLEAGASPESVRGLVFRRGERIIENEARPFIEELDKLPFPAYDLLPLERYRIPIHHVGFGKRVPVHPFFLIFTSRGCPMNCTFCASKTIWGRRVRYRSAENVLSEIEILYHRYGVRVIDIADDIFTIHKKRLHAIIDGICERKLQIHFNCLSRVDTVTEEDLKKLKRAGCYLIRYGIESGSQKILDRMHKSITPEQVEKTIGMTNRVGIACTASFMIGHPGETKETALKTIRLAKGIDANLYHFFIAVPYPGTELYKIAKREKLIRDNSDWIQWTQFPEKGVLRTESLSCEDLVKLRDKAYREVYLNIRFIWKCMTRIRTWNQGVMYLRGALAVLTLLGKRILKPDSGV
jgi:radical SAM superfamily enzyme YgiQ (UPF0313 family)